MRLAWWSTMGLAMLVIAAPAAAQAWVPPAGSGSVGVSYQIIDNTGHRLNDGYLLPDGKSTDVSLYVDSDYSVTDRLSFSIGLPYVFARYRGPGPSLANLPVDQCKCWHSGFQDFGGTIRYNLLTGRIALTPSVAAGVPSHDYAYQGEAVVGRRLNELRLAVDAGQRLDPISSRLFIQERYSYAFVERVLGVPNNRSNVSLEPGFLFTRKLSARGILAWQRTHGGLRAGNGPPAPPSFGEINTPELFAEHDRLIRDNHWHVGGAVTYSLAHVDVFGAYLEYASGTNTHAGRALTVGVSVPFEIDRGSTESSGLPDTRQHH